MRQRPHGYTLRELRPDLEREFLEFVDSPRRRRQPWSRDAPGPRYHLTYVGWGPARGHARSRAHAPTGFRTALRRRRFRRSAGAWPGRVGHPLRRDVRRALGFVDMPAHAYL